MTSNSAIALADERTKLRWFTNLSWILLLAFTLRVAIRWRFGADDFWTNGYTFFFRIAQNIAAGNGITAGGSGYAMAFHMPVYPIFLAALTFGHREFLPVLLFQSFVGVGTVFCAAAIARQMFSTTAGLIAALITAIYPYYVVHDTALQETSLYTFFTVSAVLLLMKVRRNGSTFLAACAGFVLGLAVLTRANLAPFAAVAPLWLVLPRELNALVWPRGFWLCLICAGALALTISPWLARSYWLTGSPTISTYSGFYLWLGNNPYTFSRYPDQSIDRSEGVALAALSPKDKAELEALRPNEAAVDRWFFKKGLDFILSHPWQTIGNGLRKLGAAFSVLPSPHRSFWPSLVYFLSYGPIMALGLLEMWIGRRNWRDCLIFYALFGSFIPVTVVFFGHTSYRSYLDVYWIVFAAALLARHVDGIRRVIVTHPLLVGARRLAQEVARRDAAKES